MEFTECLVSYLRSIKEERIDCLDEHVESVERTWAILRSKIESVLERESRW